MGVKNLLPKLKDITHRVNLKDLVTAHVENLKAQEDENNCIVETGETMENTENIQKFVVGVDASGWLYKAAFTCPDRVSR